MNRVGDAGTARPLSANPYPGVIVAILIVVKLEIAAKCRRPRGSKPLPRPREEPDGRLHCSDAKNTGNNVGVGGIIKPSHLEDGY